MDLSQLDNIGRSRAVLNNEPSSPLAELLSDQLNDVVQKLRDRVEYYDADAYGNLKASLATTKAHIEGDRLVIEVQGAFYWKFINGGVNGTLINRGAPNWGQQPQGRMTWKQSMREWMVARGVDAQPNRSGEVTEKMRDSFAIFLMKRIKEKGQEARPFVDDVVNDDLIQNIESEISQLVGRAIEVSLSFNYD